MKSQPVKVLGKKLNPQIYSQAMAKNLYVQVQSAAEVDDSTLIPCPMKKGLQREANLWYRGKERHSDINLAFCLLSLVMEP